MNGEYFTILDLARELKIEPNAVKVRLHRLGIKSFTVEALYEASVLDILRNVPGKGRPKKATAPEKTAKPAKPAKSKKTK